MLDTLVGAGAYATLSPRRAHLLPKIGLLYTHHVRSATQFDALKRAKRSLCLNNRRPFWVNRYRSLAAGPDAKSALARKPTWFQCLIGWHMLLALC